MQRKLNGFRKATEKMEQSYFLELVQDIPRASEIELRALSESHGFKILFAGRKFALVEGVWESLKDAAFVRRISKVIAVSDDIGDLGNASLPAGKFYVRFLDGGICHDAGVEPEIGNLLNGRGRISFSNPDFIVRAYHLDRWYACIELHASSEKDFENRRAPMRPFFSPISIHPRHARFMVNVSGTSRGDLVLDPFCGTGGILIEAGLLGRRVMGNDWSLQMASGARLNLKYFGIRGYEVENRDFLSLELEDKVDAILTDLPYGKNSRLSQKDLKDLYNRSFMKFSDILKDGGKCVIVVSDLQALKGAEEYFRIDTTLENRVHRSLTRYFAVLTKR